MNRTRILPCFVGLAVMLGQAAVSSGQDVLPRLTLTESARATISEPGGRRERTNSIGSLAFSPDGSVLAAGMSQPNLILLLDPSTLAIKERLEGHIALVMDLKFSPDGKFLISGGMDGTLRVWDLATKRQRFLVDKFQGYVRAVACSPDSTRIYTGEMARGPGIAQVWDARDGHLIASLKDYNHGIEDIELSPDGLTLATTSRDKTIRLWDSTTLEPKGLFDSAGPWANSMAFLADGKSMIAVFDDRSFRMLDVGTMREKYKVQTDAKTFLYLTVSPDGSILATGDGNRLQLWRSADGLPLASIPDTGGRIYRIQFSPDGRSIAVAGTAGFIRVFRLNRGDR